MMVVIEGVDASGKNTQSKLVQRALGGEQKCALFSFPRYGTPLGSLILRHLQGKAVHSDGLQIEISGFNLGASVRRAPEDSMVFQCLMTVDKYDAAREILKHIGEGRYVVCDRWRQSAEVYGASDGLSSNWLADIHACLPQPKTLNVYLEVSEQEALRRRPQLRDRYEQDREKQVDLRRRYRGLWQGKAFDRPLEWVILDGEQSEDHVTADILSAIQALWDA